MESTLQTAQTAAHEYKDFRLFLQSELMKRCEKNSSYSLRAFARSLRIHHSALSRILSGKRAITKKMQRSLSLALNLTPEEAAGFQSGKLDSKGQAGIRDLTVDAFTVISEWYHDAILELIRLKNFKNDPKWIAHVLGVTVSEINIAIERLERLGLVSVKGKAIVSHADRTEAGIDTPFTSVALKKYQKQILQMAIAAIDEVPKDRRLNISSTVAIDSRDIPEIKKQIVNFRRRLSRYMQRRAAVSDQVYELGICFYPVTKTEPL